MNRYLREDMEEALREYTETAKSQYQVARDYGIPRSTLNDYIRRGYGCVDQDMGRRAIGLPSRKVASDKSGWLRSLVSDTSEVASDTSEETSDMSEENATGVWNGLIIAGVVVLVCVGWQWWQKRQEEEKAREKQPAAEAYTRAQAQMAYPSLSREEAVECVKKWERIFPGLTRRGLGSLSTDFN
jgi:transposase-like protein